MLVAVAIISIALNPLLFRISARIFARAGIADEAEEPGDVPTEPEGPRRRCQWCWPATGRWAADWHSAALTRASPCA